MRENLCDKLQFEFLILIKNSWVFCVSIKDFRFPSASSQNIIMISRDGKYK